jgi:hypothetical protein
MEELAKDILAPGGLSNTRMYEKSGLAPDPRACDKPLTEANVLGEWRKGYGIVTWMSHGWPARSGRTYWPADKNGNGIADKDEQVMLPFFWQWDSAWLDNGHPSVVFSCSCDNSAPEAFGWSVSAALMTRGAVAVVGATRPVFGMADWDSEDDGLCDSVDYYFTKHLVTDGLSAGEALGLGQLEARIGSSLDLCDLYGFVLYGDPALRLNAGVK